MIKNRRYEAYFEAVDSTELSDDDFEYVEAAEEESLEDREEIRASPDSIILLKDPCKLSKLCPKYESKNKIKFTEINTYSNKAYQTRTPPDCPRCRYGQ